ncbi:NAD(P)-binding domain-containing protein [Falsihalocynthiibacter sp. S25ZX9]|uniref:NAD(P)-binding domain-containing protein n=1 Tax=Falsihalocynthiibacter sp. S25ZX9 TaxID=3240870 RepID=UPI00350EC5CC
MIRVGFVGLGRLGCHMARNLAAVGHQILLWNRSPEKAERLAQAIGYTVASPKVDRLFGCVSD